MKVNEAFVSIQGEGPGSGRRAFFVRFSGCNLACSWCDSKYAMHSYITVSPHEVAMMCDRSNCQYVVFTGGEPLMQPAGDMKALLTMLDGEVDIDIETNGTIIPTERYSTVRYIVSPKSLDVAQRWITANPNVDWVFKFVVDVDNIDELFSWILANCTKPVWLMPRTTNVGAPTECMVKEMITTGRIVQSKMIKYGIDGYLCTRLQNLYRVR